MTEYTFTIPADYGCLAIIDPENYTGFVSEDWALEELKNHFIEQNEHGSIVAWGCSYGNWIIKLMLGPSNERGFRSFSSCFKSNGKLLVTSYESLTMAAQFQDVSLPEPHETEQVIDIPQGKYKLTIIQCFQTEQAESDEVFNQLTPHYLVAIEPANDEFETVKDVPWFEGY